MFIQSDHACLRRHVHDPAEPALDHTWRDGFGKQKRASQIYGERARPMIERGFKCGFRYHDARIIHENVDAAQVPLDLTYESLDRLRIGHISETRDEASARRFDVASKSVVIAFKGESGNVRTFPRELQRHASANPSGGPRNHSNFTV